eukprot:scaffold520819_cov20-Prasinocladus_malaysianus.AAC.2
MLFNTLKGVVIANQSHTKHRYKFGHGDLPAAYKLPPSNENYNVKYFDSNLFLALIVQALWKLLSKRSCEDRRVICSVVAATHSELLMSRLQYSSVIKFRVHDWPYSSWQGSPAWPSRASGKLNCGTLAHGRAGAQLMSPQKARRLAHLRPDLHNSQPANPILPRKALNKRPSMLLNTKSFKL